MKLNATMTAYYNRDPQELIIDGPTNEIKAFIKTIGFRPNCMTPDVFYFKSEDGDEIEQVVNIVRLGGVYLTKGHFDFAFQS